VEKCTPDNPCPSDDDGMKWIHDFETKYSGQWFDVLECQVCGFQLKAEPREHGE
jgi:hypothetical protein